MSGLTLSASAIGVLQSCAKKYRLKYIENLEAIDRPSYLTLGTAFHKCVEIKRKGGTLHDMRTEALKAEDDDMRCVLLVMVEAYYRKYAEESGFSEVEFEFICELPDGTQVKGVADALAKNGDGFLIYETKTASAVDGTYLKKLWSSRQALMYCHFISRSGYKINGVMWDLVKKPTIHRLKATPIDKRKYKTDKHTGEKTLYANQRIYAETDAEFIGRLQRWYSEHPEALHRELVVYSEQQLKAIAEDVEDEAERLRWHKSSQKWPRSLSSCHKYRSPCEYAALCHSGGNPLILETHYQRKEN